MTSAFGSSKSPEAAVCRLATLTDGTGRPAGNSPICSPFSSHFKNLGRLVDVSMPPSILIHPLARGLDIDSPVTTHIRRRILRAKPFLRRIYEEWYEAILSSLPAIAGPVLEIGTGAGFLSE